MLCLISTGFIGFDYCLHLIYEDWLNLFLGIVADYNKAITLPSNYSLLFIAQAAISNYSFLL